MPKNLFAHVQRLDKQLLESKEAYLNLNKFCFNISCGSVKRHLRKKGH